MMRDYAKSSTKRNKHKSSHLGLWVVVIFLFTIFTLSLVFFGKHKLKNNPKDQIVQVNIEQETVDKKFDGKPEKNKEKIKKTKSKIKDTKNKDVSKKTEEVKIDSEVVPPPKFDFYTILPEKNDNRSMTGYEIEIAVTKDHAVAENLKTQLGLLGLVAQVTAIQKTGGESKYRVSIGPYDNKPAAATDLAKILQGKIRGKIKKIY